MTCANYKPPRYWITLAHIILIELLRHWRNKWHSGEGVTLQRLSLLSLLKKILIKLKSIKVSHFESQQNLWNIYGVRGEFRLWRT